MKTTTHHIVLLIIVSLVAFFLFSFTNKNKQVEKLTNHELINKIFEAIDNVKTLRYNLQCNERIKGKMIHTESKVKLQVSPRKLYLYIKGIEVLWIQNWNNGFALVNPNAFPYIDLALDTYGSIMRKDQHHTIHEMGFHYMSEIVKDGMKKVGGESKIDKYFSVFGEENFEGRPCYKIALTYPDFAWVPYTVKKGDNITFIARHLHVSEYMVLERNPQCSNYTDVKPGQVIQVPNAYSKLTLLLIDKEYFLPVNNKVFDDRGLFETYDYHNLQVNPEISPEEFTKNYKEYHF